MAARAELENPRVPTDDDGAAVGAVGDVLHTGRRLRRQQAQHGLPVQPAPIGQPQHQTTVGDQAVGAAAAGSQLPRGHPEDGQTAGVELRRRHIVRGLVAGLLGFALLLTGTLQGAVPHGASQERPSGYRVVLLAGLGGTSSAGHSINNRGWVAGYSDLPGDRARHAGLWKGRAAVDLGTLGGPNSAVLWPVKNVRGLVTGISQTAERDPLGERWSCAAFFPAATGTGYRCVGFTWRAGVMRRLPTLGGTHGFASGANNAGRVVGWAENEVRDPTCVAPQVLQFRAVLWGPGKGQLRELPPLPGDSVSAATALNDAARSSASPATTTRRWAGSAPSTPCAGSGAGRSPSGPWAAWPGTRRCPSTTGGRWSASPTFPRPTAAPSTPRLPVDQAPGHPRPGHAGGRHHQPGPGDQPAA